MDKRWVPEKFARGRIEAAASLLLEHWLAGQKLAFLPEDLKPHDRATAYEVSRVLAELSGDNVIGWKIAATSGVGQRHINVDGPLAGRLLSSRVVSAGGQITLGNNIMRGTSPSHFADRQRSYICCPRGGLPHRSYSTRSPGRPCRHDTLRALEAQACRAQ